MTRRNLIIILIVAAVLIAAAIFGYTLTRGVSADPETQEAREEAKEARIERACGSSETYDRLKELVFDRAARIRQGDSAALDQLAAASIVRMERPVVKSRDDSLNITVCTGRFILELPPGAENAFDGQRRLEADIEYAAQAAVDGSGLVYSMEGAEPIIYRLATVGGVRPARQPADQPPVPIPGQPAPSADGEAPPAPAEDTPPAPDRAMPLEEPRDRPDPPRRQTANPSFDCGAARSRSERMVCSSPALAALDRQMSSLFYSALADADSGTRAELRRSRDRFLAYRERCGSEVCIAQAYRDRMAEIRDIAAGY